MPIINKSLLVSYSAREMFELVDAIPAYPEFLPWCRESHELARTNDEVQASLVVARGGIHKTFTTCNRLQPYKMIEIRLLNGPFHHFEGFWQFHELEASACKVALDLEFEMAGKWLDKMMLGPIFHQMANSLVDAFCQRAEKIYGKR